MSRKVFYPTPTLRLLRGGSKKFTNDLGLLYCINVNKGAICGVGAGLFSLFVTFNAVGEPAPTAY